MPLDISFAVPDWWERLQRGETPMPQLPLNEAKARKAVALYDSLRLPDVRGKPRLKEAGAEWFREIVRAALAAEHPETGDKLVNEVFILVPKKNSKTTNSAALGLTALMLSDIPNAEMVILGPTQKIASRCFRQARGMIKADPRLGRLFHISDNEKRITRLKTGAQLSVKTFDMDVIGGDIPVLVIVDEEHLIAAKRFAKRIMAQIRGGMITNPDALLVIITTQSDVEPIGVFKDDLAMARAVRDGEITEGGGLLPCLYEFPEEVQLDEEKPWLDPKMWGLVLPNLGYSVLLPLLQRLFLQEQRKGKDSLRIWASQHLNIQVGMGTQDGRWIAADDWPSCKRDGLADLDEIIALSDVMVVGGDVGGSDDLFSFGALGRHRETRHWMFWTHCWCLEKVYDLRPDIAVRLDEYRDAGELTVTDTSQEQVEKFVDLTDRIMEAGRFPKEDAIGLDPYGVAALEAELLGRGYPPEMIYGVSQGYRLNGAIKGLTRRMHDRTILHGGQGIMSWMMGNAKALQRGNNVMVTKELAGSGKIDGLISLFNGAVLMDLDPVADDDAVSFGDDYRAVA